MSANKLWCREGGSSTELRVLGAPLIAQPEGYVVQRLDVYWDGTFRDHLQALGQAARAQKLNLAYTRLRARLEMELSPLLYMDRALCTLPPLEASVERPALSVRQGLDVDRQIATVSVALQSALSYWSNSELMPFAQKHGLTGLADQVWESLGPDAFRIVESESDLWSKSGPPQMDTLIRYVGQLLHGQELFDGLGLCYLVSRPQSRTNWVELMSAPCHVPQGSFSMVARVSLETIPYREGLLVKASPFRRIWMKEPPKWGGPVRRTSGYFLPGNGKLALNFEILRKGREWVLGDDYPALLQHDPTLPQDVAGLCARLTAPPENWVGMPYHTAYGWTPIGRATFEFDEVSLFERVCAGLEGMVGKEIAPLEVKITARSTQKLHQIRLKDFTVEEHDTGNESEEGAEERWDQLEDQRQFRREAIEALHPGGKPTLWIIAREESERTLLSRTAETLFGDALELRRELLPEGAHGLTKNLPGADLKARGRLPLRIAAWQDVVKEISRTPGQSYVLICARKNYATGEESKTSEEDPVNYFAGISAMCQAGANVHHVLPPVGPDALQDFVQRASSALLDLLFGHNGYLHGVDAFLRKHFDEDKAPDSIYGVQVVRKNGARYTGQRSTAILAVTRLGRDNASCWVRFGHASVSGPELTEWMQFREGLRWMAGQGTISLGPADQLAANAEGLIAKALALINAEDPNAIVLADWAALKGIWGGLSDQRLSGGQVGLLSRTDLSKLFPKMRVVRIRRGDPTLPLRAIKSTPYAGFLEDPSSGVLTRTGEIHNDVYCTTRKALVKLSEVQGCATHFLGTHGYGGVPVSIPRGLSAYRYISRATEVSGKGGKQVEPLSGRTLFTLEQKNPAYDVDQGTPAPIEITVALAPAGDGSDRIASAVMGLRSGYGHFGSWTGLPAPLFFRSKIEDYFVQYNLLEEDEDPEAEADTAQTGPAPSDLCRETAPSLQAEAPPAPVSRAVFAAGIWEEQGIADRILGPPGVATPPQGPEPAHEPQAESEPVEADLDALAAKELLNLLLQRDFSRFKRADHLKAYRETIRQGIRIPIPALVTRTMLDRAIRATNRDVRLLWEAMFKARLEPPGTPRKRPESVDTFRDWIYAHLDIPHFLAVLDSLLQVASGRSGGMIMDSFAKFTIESKAFPVDNAADLPGDFLLWLFEKEMWEEIHWFIFREGQEPNRSYRGALNDVLDGEEPETVLQCVRYVLCSDEHLEKMLAPQPPSAPAAITPNVAPAPPSAPTAPAVGALHSRPLRAPPNQPPPGTQDVPMKEAMPDTLPQPPNLAANTLFRLRILVSELDPARDDTPARCDEIRGLIGEVEQLHQAHLATALRAQEEQQAAQEQQRKAQERAEAIERMAGRARQLAETLLDKRLTKDIPAVSPWQPAADADPAALALQFDSAEAQYADFVRAIGTLQDYLKQQHDGIADPEDPEYIELFGRARRARIAIRDALAGLGMLGTAAPQPAAPPESCARVQSCDNPLEEAPPTPPALVPSPSPAIIAQAQPTTEPIEEQTPPALVQPAVLLLAQPMVPVEQPPAMPDAAPEPVAESINAGNVFARFVQRNEFALASVTLSRSLDAAGVDMRLGQFAMDAAQRALVMEPVSDLSAQDLEWVQDIGAGIEWSDDLAQQSSAMAMMAGLIAPALFSPGNNVVSTFVAIFEGSLADATPLHELTEHLRQMQSYPMDLSPAQIRGATQGGQKALEEMHKQMVAECAQWLDRGPPRRQYNHGGIAKILADIYRDTGAIMRAVSALASGGRNAAARALVNDALGELSNPHQMVQSAARRQRSARGLPTPLLHKIEVGAKDTKELLERAASLLDELVEEHRVSRVDAFLHDLHGKLDAARIFLKTLEQADGFHRGFAVCAQRSIECLLAMYEALKSREPALSNEEQLLTIPLVLDAGLRPASWLPDAVVLSALSDLSEAEPMPPRVERLTEAYDKHLTALHMYPAEALLSILGNAVFSEPERKQHREMVNRQRAQLRERLHAAGRQVNMAEAMQSIPTKTAREMQRTLKGILSTVDTIARYPATNDLYPDFPFAYEKIQTHVEKELETNASRGRDAFLQMVESQIQEVPERLWPRVAKVRELANMGLGKLVAAREMFRVLKKGEDVSDKVFRNTDLHEFVDFMKFIDTLGAADPVRAVIEMLGRGDKHALFEKIEGQRDEVAKLLAAWETACRDDTTNSARTAAVNAVLHGFDLRGANLEPQPGGAGAQHYTIDPVVFSGVRPFVPPELGSLGSCSTLDLHVLPARKPTTEQIQSMIGAATRPGLAFMRDRCDAARRAELAADNRGYSKLILVDDYLALFLALSVKNRPRRLLQAGLSTCKCAPYKDVSPVPREMFRGREDVIDQIRNLSGGRILYGGRRLGKTSVLDTVSHIISSEHRAGEFAVRVNMEKMSSLNYRNEAWNRIYNDLVKAKVMLPAALGGLLNHERIIKALEKALDDEATKSVLLMLDEADDLMEADAESMLFVGDLNRLTEKHGHNRFRFIIAGLHNVQRLLRAPNSPLRKMDSPIAIKPFIDQRDREAGIQLIVEPLAALGFEFEEVAMPFLILANAHFYPALLQESMKALLNVAYKERGKQPAPYTITWDLIAKLEKDTELSTKLREKFEGNLDLDTRYMVIAYIFALRQYDSTDNADSTPLMSRAELRSECEVYAPGLFSRAEDHVYECLLEEMVNLNVLEKDGSSRYMLATPNIAFMLGTREHIESELERRSQIPEEPKKDALAEYPYVSDPGRAFPLNFGLLHTCTADQGRPVTVLVGNKASGLDTLKHWEGVIPGTSSITLVYHAGMPLKNARARQAFRLKAGTQTGPRDIIVHVFEPGCWTIMELSMLGTLVKELEPTNGRIWLLADCDGQAIELAKREYKGQALKGVRVEAVPPWSSAGIQTYLKSAHRSIRDTQAAVDHILQASGGYGDWVMQLCQKCPTDEDLRNALAAAKTSFLPQPGQLLPRLGVDVRFDPLIQALIDGKTDSRSCYARATEVGFEEFDVDYLRWMGLIKVRPSGVLDANELIYSL